MPFNSNKYKTSTVSGRIPFDIKELFTCSGGLMSSASAGFGSMRSCGQCFHLLSAIVAPIIGQRVGQNRIDVPSVEDGKEIAREIVRLPNR
jgi:hypothetical protein